VLASGFLLLAAGFGVAILIITDTRYVVLEKNPKFCHLSFIHLSISNFPLFSEIDNGQLTTNNNQRTTLK
jgi:hypothetical protein